jgi:hypothetical protein
MNGEWQMTSENLINSFNLGFLILAFAFFIELAPRSVAGPIRPQLKAWRRLGSGFL